MVIAKNIIYKHKTKDNMLAQVIELIKDEEMVKVEIYDYQQITPMKKIYTFKNFHRNFTYMESWYHVVDQSRLAFEHEGVLFVEGING